MDSDRLKKQIKFIVEVDKLKNIMRQTLVTDGSRQENSAEHSWHIAVMAMLLQEYAKDPSMDMTRVLKMLLIHDLVEIDAGDTYCYDAVGNEDKLDREQKAAERIFGLLPVDQSEEFRRLWDEFELRETAEARFAAALDRLQPLLNNYSTNGRMWQKHRIKSSQVFSRNQPIEDALPTLWEYAADMILDAVNKDWLRK